MVRLRQQIALTADPVLKELRDELSGYAPPEEESHNSSTWEGEEMGIAVPFRLMTEDGILTFLSTTMVFGSPVNVTLSEIAIEAFFPADTETSTTLLRR